MNVQTTVVDVEEQITAGETIMEATLPTVVPPANSRDVADARARVASAAWTPFVATTPGTKSASTCA